MYDKKKLDELRTRLKNGRRPSLQESAYRPCLNAPTNLLQLPLNRSTDSTPRSMWRISDYASSLGLPGEYPFTRGVHPTLHRSKLWTMRMFAGFGTAEETNARFKYLLDQGQTGLIGRVRSCHSHGL